MVVAIHQNLNKGLDTLYDLKKLINFSDNLVLDQAIHHLIQLRQKLPLQEGDKIPEDSGIYNFIKNGMQDLLQEYLLSSPSVTGLDYSSQSDGMNVQDWDKILKTTPRILQILKLLNMSGKININIHAEGMLIEGKCSLYKIDPKVKMKLVQFTKLLLKDQGILTYNTDVDQTTLRLNLDLSTRVHQYYSLEVQLEDGPIKLAFPNSFENYVVAENMLEEIKSAKCLEVREDLTLVRYSNLQAANYDFKDPQFSKCLLHFSFLFRPISMIIPKRGIVEFVQDGMDIFTMSDSMQWDRLQQKQDVFCLEQQQNFLFYIDFFSLLSHN